LNSERLKRLAKAVLNNFRVRPTRERIGAAESLRDGVRAASGHLIHDEVGRCYVLVRDRLVWASRSCVISNLALNESPRADQRVVFSWRVHNILRLDVDAKCASVGRRPGTDPNVWQVVVKRGSDGRDGKDAR
jgi:hypothetical protein